MSDGIRFFSAGTLSVAAIILLAALIIVILPLFILGIIGVAFSRMGFSWITALAIVLLLLLGSLINIPLYRFARDMIRIVPDSAAAYPPGSPGIWETQVSINLGGAVIPVVLSLYLLYRSAPLIGSSIVPPVGLGVITVALVTFVSTRTIAGAGIRVPFLIPALAALVTGFLLCGGTGISSAVTAFVSGTVGTLLGGNIAQLFRIQDLEVPEVSIGGAGTFSAVFVCCVLPALLA